MIKTILVPATGAPEDAAALAAALPVARLFNAHIDVLHVRFDPASAAVAMASDAGSGALTAGLLDQLEQDARDREAKGRQAFAKFCADAGIIEGIAPAAGSAAAPSAAWHVEVGEEPRWVATYGLTADLVLAPRPPEAEALGRATLEAALLETGRPLLIPASAAIPASFARIAIAWKATPQAARAVALALPFLSRAKEVTVLTVEERPDERDTTDRLVANLGGHGLAAKVERLRPTDDGAVAALLATARQRADLLVMGGYGHTRLREWVFGGFTQEVLSAAPLPVLLAH
jgi:nucleotide-binding universal stress UspA family protein